MIQLKDIALDCGAEREPLVLDRLDIARGAFLPVVARCGEALDSFLNLLALLHCPKTGSYRLDGVEVYGMSAAARERLRREKVGRLFLDDSLNKNVATRRSAPGSVSYMRYTIVSHQKLKYALACLYADYPQLVVVGQPSGLIDSEQNKNMIDCLRELHERGATILLATDDPEVVAAAGDCITLGEKAVATA